MYSFGFSSWGLPFQPPFYILSLPPLPFTSSSSSLSSLFPLVPQRTTSQAPLYLLLIYSLLLFIISGITAIHSSPHVKTKEEGK
jgi:hypothetical protein